MSRKKTIITISVLFLAASALVAAWFWFDNNSKKQEADYSMETANEDYGIIEKNEDLKNEEDANLDPLVEKREDGEKISFAVIGDTQRFDSGNPNGGFQKAVKNISEKNVDLIMTVGDLLSSCNNGCEKKLNEWENILGPLSGKAYAVMGNHDRTGKKDADEAWQKAFNLPSNGPSGYSELAYSFDFKNSHFIVLNSEKPKEHIVNKDQRDWLEKDLLSNKKENTFIFFHQPAYPVSSKIDESLDVKEEERDALWKILSKYKVTAVFNGHEHIHSRRKIDGVYQFVFGNTDSFDHELPKSGVAEYAHKGQTFGIVEVDGKEVTVKLYSVDGNLINSFKFISSL